MWEFDEELFRGDQVVKRGMGRVSIVEVRSGEIIEEAFYDKIDLLLNIFIKIY